MGYDFDLRVEQAGDGLARVVVFGEIDMAVADVLCAAVAGALCADGVHRVEVDSDGVRFIDAAGVSALLRCYSEAQLWGKAFRVRGMHGLPLRVLEVTGVDGLLCGKGAEGG